MAHQTAHPFCVVTENNWPIFKYFSKVLILSFSPPYKDSRAHQDTNLRSARIPPVSQAMSCSALATHLPNFSGFIHAQTEDHSSNKEGWSLVLAFGSFLRRRFFSSSNDLIDGSAGNSSGILPPIRLIAFLTSCPTS